MTTTQFGEHITIDGYNGDRKLLNSRKAVLNLLLTLPDKLGMNILKKPSIVSAPDNGLKDSGGWTGFVIIAESHISIHTFPKRGFVSADIYTCKSGMDTKTIINYFTETFKLSDIETHFIKRGTRYPVEDIKQSNLEKITELNKANVQCGKSPLSYGFTHFAKKTFHKGDVVVKGIGEIVPSQTSHFSIQIATDKHFIPTKWTGKYWNHSCNPNCYVKTREDGFPDLIALENIEKGEEITYAYYMTEYEWCKEAEERTIKCKCKNENCCGRILSFSELSKEEKIHLIHKGTLSNYLKAITI
jgi:S-adenosylmethionine decarboxylase